ncbi:MULTISPECIES: hypothetical protein [unclassified Streptomyces]|uniref:hypothetical protein n=1 Tax=unclassified Streptomyces TaxID=2593676 RepID=UPI00364CBAF3
MATEVLVERADLDDGILMIYREFGRRVRMAFDPTRITERAALTLLGQRVPGADALEVHRVGT